MLPETEAETEAETETAADQPPGAAARRTLALRIAERNRLRALRAERLARLRPDAPARDESRDEDAAGALEAFLRALTGAAAPAEPAPEPAAVPAPEPAAVLPFQRPEPAPAPEPETAGGLDRLPGAGPGLVWALQRAGLGSLAAVAALDARELAARLGPLGRLVPAAAWIEAARREA